ncbi:hypothetical protein MATL_G00157480 [Megalops atlanticus]|uniref:Glutamate-rich protein 1 n=1 Tax=Megalops atlanticus TaxID=7932 RepID=A0A9D3PQH9_MEGAT|nr:hypothetical protein MATL_G00157480 [Megalops atlanticus]
MASRKEVFLDKLMKRLYPSPAKAEIPQATGSGGVSVAEKTAVKVKNITHTVTGDGGKNRLPQKRLYTVLMPPDGFKTGAEESTALSEPGDINSEGDPDVGTQGEDSPELSSGGQWRRRRKRKAGGAPGGGAEERGKGKATGSIAGAAPVEFTYQPGGGQEEEEEEEEVEEEEHAEECTEKRRAEVLDFLQTTQELYLSDTGSSVAGKPQSPDRSVPALLASLSAGTAPPADVTRIHHLKSLVLLQDTDRLTNALEDFQRSSTLPSEETSVICSLFHYWLTDILPMWRNRRSSDQTTQQL